MLADTIRRGARGAFRVASRRARTAQHLLRDRSPRRRRKQPALRLSAASTASASCSPFFIFRSSVSSPRLLLSCVRARYPALSFLSLSISLSRLIVVVPARADERPLVRLQLSTFLAASSPFPPPLSPAPGPPRSLLAPLIPPAPLFAFRPIFQCPGPTLPINEERYNLSITNTSATFLVAKPQMVFFPFFLFFTMTKKPRTKKTKKRRRTLTRTRRLWQRLRLQARQRRRRRR